MAAEHPEPPVRTEISLAEARQTGDALRVDWRALSVEQLRSAMLVELEHGRRDWRTDVTADDLEITAMIALAHFEEGLEYYDLLAELEAKLKLKRATRVSPFLVAAEKP